MESRDPLPDVLAMINEMFQEEARKADEVVFPFFHDFSELMVWIGMRIFSEAVLLLLQNPNVDIHYRSRDGWTAISLAYDAKAPPFLLSGLLGRVNLLGWTSNQPQPAVEREQEYFTFNAVRTMKSMLAMAPGQVGLVWNFEQK